MHRQADRQEPHVLTRDNNVNKRKYTQIHDSPSSSRSRAEENPEPENQTRPTESFLSPQSHALSLEHQKTKRHRFATEQETNQHRLDQRQRQIDYGKNTIGYDNYCRVVPRHVRKTDAERYLYTPNKHRKMGKKKFDHLIRTWRQFLHQYDDDLDDQEKEDTTAEDPGPNVVETPHTPAEKLAPQDVVKSIISTRPSTDLFQAFDENESSIDVTNKKILTTTTTTVVVDLSDDDELL